MKTSNYSNNVHCIKAAATALTDAANAANAYANAYASGADETALIIAANTANATANTAFAAIAHIAEVMADMHSQKK